MTPLGTQVLINPLKAEEQKTESGIIIKQQGDKEPTSQGIVKTVSNDVKIVKAGDKVLYPTGSGTKVTLDGEELLLIDSSKLLAILSRSVGETAVSNIP